MTLTCLNQANGSGLQFAGGTGWKLKHPDHLFHADLVRTVKKDVIVKRKEKFRTINIISNLPIQKAELVA